MTADLDIRHHAAAHRFSVTVDGHECELDYTVIDDIPPGGPMTITHTGVPSAVAGRGVAAALVRAALDLARAEHWQVVPACSYANAWMRRHPDYEDLRA